MSKAADFVARTRAWLTGLPVVALVALGMVLVAGSGAGGYYAYKAYDYIEHDNEFCFSCHLMQDPYELFAESAHRGLSCKACHQPNMLQRSTMGATAVIVNPDTISAHAEVPNDLCADCHVNGDPEKWALVENSAGHRIHFESEDSALVGLQCVECHQSSLHQFTAVDETCAQSGCHTESTIQLGAMGDLTMHCAACHGFSAVAENVEQASTAISPDQDTCLSCHAMRVLLELPEDDPHDGACGSCHNPHDQATPAEAVQSCSTAGCHEDPLDESAFHVGLSDEVIADCLYCHQAHDFHADGSDCTACHQDILQDDPSVRITADAGSAAPSPVHGAGATFHGLESRPAGGAALASALAPGASAMHSWGYPIPQELTFLHSEHPSVSCTECHETTERHGGVTVTTVTDCRSCHHAEERLPADGCAACHQESGSTADPYSVAQSLSFSVGVERVGRLPFDHGVHDGQDCAACHQDGLELSAAQVDCASCHEDHHEPDASCMSCHQASTTAGHVIETAHVTCSGAGCHQDVPFEGLPRTRDVCLTCHQDQVDHRPGERCAECHAMPEVGGSP